MKQLIFTLLIIILFSCNSRAPIDVKQIDSQEAVTILPSLKNPLIKDSLSLSIPIELEIHINSSKVSYITWNYIVNGKSQYDDTFDYQVYNKRNKTHPISNLNANDLSHSRKIINIILKERNHLISKKEAKELLKKYHINRSLDNLKFGDTIKLTTYDKFKKENKEIIKNITKINDSISFKVTRGEKYFFFLDKKINW
ncbi:MULTISPECIES: hypothetical protein [Flavobacterium]|nr:MULTISPECIES: hypothetical protein [Flavobacterium]MBW1655222.1 hypothetical protein [Flavobacterium quisquiliarum]